jgi:hypothetical protein
VNNKIDKNFPNYYNESLRSLSLLLIGNHTYNPLTKT